MTEFDLICIAAEQFGLPENYYKDKNFFNESNLIKFISGKSIAELFEIVCRAENIQCEYSSDDFSGTYVSYKDIKMIQINMPQRDTEINKSQRLYFLYKGDTNREIKTKAYFIVVKNKEENNEIYYIAPNMEHKLIATVHDNEINERMIIIKAYKNIL
jgi:hypothetical protein